MRLCMGMCMCMCVCVSLCVCINQFVLFSFAWPATEAVTFVFSLVIYCFAVIVMLTEVHCADLCVPFIAFLILDCGALWQTEAWSQTELYKLRVT